MDHVDQDPTVRAVAGALGISEKTNLREEICSRAVGRVETWMGQWGISPENLDDVQKAVLNQTGLRTVMIETNHDLHRIQSQYAAEHRALPIQFELEFRRDTEALVFQQRPKKPAAPSYIAVVDARGPRRARAWFAERHEPVHILIPDPNANVIWRRTQRERPEPIEQVVDTIASRIGFWKPIVHLELLASLRHNTCTLDAFDIAKYSLAPEASREACYRAFTRLVDFPLIVLRSGYDCRKQDREPGGDPSKSLALRAKTVIWNDLADHHGMHIWQNFRIPPGESVIANAHMGFAKEALIQDDNLGRWTSESGHALKSCPVRISARGSWATIELAG